MTRLIARRTALIGLAATAAGCAAVPPRRAALEHSGAHHEDEGGIGGTGVFGVVTALGSIVVGGERIETPQGAFAIAPRIGDAVVLAATRGADGGLVAESGARFTPLLGPVTDVFEGGVAVMGARALYAPAAMVEAPQIGDWVRVSGLWRGGALAATRVEPAVPGRAEAAGMAVGAAPALSVGGVAVRGAAAREFGFAAVSGLWRDGALIAERVQTRPFGPFDRPMPAALVEGFMAPDPVGPGVHLSGFGTPYDPASTATPLIGARAIFRGRIGEAFFVEEITPVAG